MRQRKVIRTTSADLVVAVTDEVMLIIRDLAGLYMVVPYVFNGRLTRRHLHVHKRSRQE